MKNNKMTKDTVPEGFSVVMALVDLIPVVFFGLSAVRVGRLFQGALFVTGALICLLSGVVKVLWKLIAAVSRRNIWPMFVQMRIFMPAGFLLLLAALIALSRLYLYVHFPTDVLGGAALGILSGWLGVRLTDLAAGRKNNIR